MNFSKRVSRRRFLQRFSLLGATSLGGGAIFSSCTSRTSPIPPPVSSLSDALVVDDFQRPDSFYMGDGWESMNPGYWMVKEQTLRRRLSGDGDQRPTDWFPWHWETHRDTIAPTDYDPSLPFGMAWRRDWQLSDNYSIRIDFTIHSLPEYDDNSNHLQHTPGYAALGICFGSSCLHESWTGSETGETASLLKSLIPGRRGHEAAWMALLTDDSRFGIYSHATDELAPIDGEAETHVGNLKNGTRGSITLFVSGDGDQYADVSALLTLGDDWFTIQLPRVNRISYTNGYFGIVSRGLMDVEINKVSIDPGGNFTLNIPTNELHVCYPLGDTLQLKEDGWHCKFIALCRNDGQEVSIRVSTEERPPIGWENVADHGRAALVNNTFRRNTAVIDVTLPFDPTAHTLYYTVWKDGVNVTADPRQGTQSVGPGSGFIGKVPRSGSYVGRLPRLKAPYRICGLSCHAIHENNPDLPDSGRYQTWYVHDQPTPDAFRHLESFNFQVMLWEDDVWYLELMFPPPSTDDAYKVITTTIAGPTSRWQMMRHWNVLNPGDHDFGMDDVKGPEQWLVRNREGLGQDIHYMRRNFQIVQHLMTGDEDPMPGTNPKNWRKWRMPDRDFSLFIMDARLWRTSQDTNIWDDEGWGANNNLNDRTNPTRTLLGEEQFSWLEQQLKSDASPLICITGINGLHTIWSGIREDVQTGLRFDQRDRVTADYAGWVKAGSDRTLDLIGQRPGVTTVYGDVHNGCIMYNKEHRIAECSFGPIGRGSGRSPKESFGADMLDYDGRPLHVYALYHADYDNPNLTSGDGPFYWNFLEMQFDTTPDNPSTLLALRNLIDEPASPYRGGNALQFNASQSGRPAKSIAPHIVLLPNADVQFTLLSGETIQATRSKADGTIPITRFSNVEPATSLLATAYTSETALSLIITTLPTSS